MSPRPGPKAIDPPDFGKLPAVDDGERVLSFYGGGGEVAAVTGGGGRTAAVEARIGGGRRLVREQQRFSLTLLGLVFAFKLERGSCGIQKLHGPL
uniref:Uncharacterized protein n=1 Tax=Leersia perrieri TaxID=77586 RepID=A0A0D9VPU0_9ORYZ